MMSKRIENESYPFSWLDEVIEVTLNPEKTDPITVQEAVLKDIKTRLPNEMVNIINRIKTQAFCLYSNEQVKCVAGHYDLAIRMLQTQAQLNLAQNPESGLQRDTCQLIIDGINELYFNVRQRYQTYLTESAAEKSEDEALFKVLCKLSVDQVAIILKAADDVKLLVSRSFSLVLRRIVPFLSTERLKNFSWKSARSSTYKMERNDKEVAIQTLEALISKIKEY